MSLSLFPGAHTTLLAEQWLDGWHACNPSIAKGKYGYAAIVTCRDLDRDGGNGFTFADESGAIRTRNFFAYLDEATLAPYHPYEETPWREIPTPDVEMKFWMVRGIEDPRLYWHEGYGYGWGGYGWAYTGSIREHHESGEHRTICSTVHPYPLIEPLILDAPSGTWVKNLMPTGRLPEFIDAMDSNPDFHGGAVVPYEDGYLGVVHEVVGQGRQYFHRLTRFDQSGRLTKASPRFRFGETHIEFAAGIVLWQDQLVVSYGAQDHQARLAYIPLDSALRVLDNDNRRPR